MGLGHVELAMVQAEAAKSGFGPWVLNCQAPDEGNMHTLLHWATDEQKEKYLRPLCEGTAWSCFAMTEPEVAGSDPTLIQTNGVPGRRRVGDQRAQVVHLQRPPRQLRHPHRPHRGRPGPPAGGQHRVHRRPAVRRVDRGAPDRDDARLDRPLRDPHRGPARARVADARRPRPGSPARAVPARPGPAGALHALDRPGRDGARHDGRPLAQPVRPRLAARREAGHPVDDRRLGDGAVPGEADGPARRLQDRPRRGLQVRGVDGEALRGQHAQPGDRPLDPGARRARLLDRHAAGRACSSTPAGPASPTAPTRSTRCASPSGRSPPTRTTARRRRPPATCRSDGRSGKRCSPRG